MLPAIAKPYSFDLDSIHSRVPPSVSALPAGSGMNPVENISGSTTRSVSGKAESIVSSFLRLASGSAQTTSVCIKVVIIACKLTRIH